MPDPNMLYYPYTVLGYTIWGPVPAGTAVPASARPYGQIPAGAIIEGTPEAARIEAQIPMPGQPGTPGQPSTPGDTTTARARAAQMLYGAMRGLPFLAPEFLGSLQAGEVPRPGAVTPQALGYLAGDTMLSDSFFSLIRAAGLYPTTFLAETARFQPRGRDVSPSFI